jgi:hypothetical protein
MFPLIKRRLPMELTINPKFHDLIPPISKEEYDLLEQSILKEGCRDAIITWDDTILDGHNRYEICQKHDIRFKTIDKSFENEVEAKFWIIRNQLARRNLPAHERTRLALMLKPVIEEKAKEKQREHGGTAPGKSLSQKSDEGGPAAVLVIGNRKYVEDIKGRTDEKIAKIAGVSRDTVRKVEVIEQEGTEEVKQAARKGEMSVNKAYKKIKGDEKKEKNEKLYKETLGPQKDPKREVTEAKQFATIAISQLQRIRLNDPRRDEQLTRVLNWIIKNKGGV